jgi:DNA-binding MarR family transcriptional regulator
MSTCVNRDEKLSRAIHLFMKTLRLHRCVFAKTVGQFNMPHAQHRTLMFLAKEDRKLSQKQIADRLEISAAAVAVLLKKLESNGYIKKSSCPGDNRINEIELTEKGCKTVAITDSSFRENDISMFDGFDEEELDCYIRLLEKIETNLYRLEDNISYEGETSKTKEDMR